jgi:hypothetical protein
LYEDGWNILDESTLEIEMTKTVLRLLFVSLALSCGQKKPPSASDPTKDPQEVVKPGQIAGSLLSVGIVVDAPKGLVLLLSRLKTAGEAPTLDQEPRILLETDPEFTALRVQIADYPNKKNYIVSSSEGSQNASVAGIAVTSASCGTSWAAYPLLVTQQPLPEGEVAVILRTGEASGALSSRRMLDVSPMIPEVVQTSIEKISPRIARREQRYWSRFVELDGDSGAEIVVARLLFEPLGDNAAREAVVESFWLDESKGAWSVLSKNTREIAQEDLLRFSPNQPWEKWISPPVLVVDLESDKIAEVIRASLDGYSLWRVDAGALHQISFAQLASQERCE